MRTITAGFTLALFLAISAPLTSLAAAAAGPATAAPITDASITVATGSITYTTRAGDTLSSIAAQLTDKAGNWVTLSQVNRIGSDTNIPIGTAILIPASILPDEPSQAKVVALYGSINAQSAQGAPMPVALGAVITEGMQIDTGNNGFMTLVLPDASRISIPSNSRVKISKLRMARYTKSPRTEITLLRGRIESRVSPIESNQGQFEILTPRGVAGVRGTHFRVAVEGNTSINEVLSGKVAVGQAGKSPALTLQRGQGNIISAQSVGKATPLLPAPQLSDVPTMQQANTAQFSMQPLAGARSYHVQLATDADGQNIIAETRADKPRFEMNGVSEGSYFARLSAIDPSGLEGFVRTQPITLKLDSAVAAAVLPAPSAPFVDGSDKRTLTLRWDAVPGQKFRVQVARDAAFSWLLFNASTTTAEAQVRRPAFGTYFARVQRIDADGSVSAFSGAQAFIVTDQWVINDGAPGSPKQNRAVSAR